MTESERAHLRAELRALVAENAKTLNLAPTAALDMTNRLLAAGALLTGGRVAMPDGSSPIGYVENVFRADPEAAHLFAPLATERPSAPHAPAPKRPTPRRPSGGASTPAEAAKTRAEYLAGLTARLAQGNGHD